MPNSVVVGNAKKMSHVDSLKQILIDKQAKHNIYIRKHWSRIFSETTIYVVELRYQNDDLQVNYERMVDLS